MGQSNKTYEIMYFLPITAEAEEIKQIKSKVNEILTKHQATIITEEEIGKRKLAYMIKRARHGYYILTAFSAQPNSIAQINHQIELMPEVLRHRIVIKPQNTQSSQAPSTGSTTEGRDEQKSQPSAQAEKSGQVDIKELDKKIDELLSEDLTDDLKEKL